MFCSKCGKEIEEGASFCSNCGNISRADASIENSFGSRKSNVKLPVILGICAVAIILIAVSISVLGKKADKVTKIVKAYESTINADNFQICTVLGNDWEIYEVFGKGSLEDTYIATFLNQDLIDDADNWTDYVNEDNLWRLIHEDYYIGNRRGNLRDGASNWFAYEEYEMIANRDFEGLWNHEIANVLGLDYDKAYDLAINVVLDYLKNKDESAVENIEIEDNRYVICLDIEEIDDFVEDSEYKDTIAEVVDALADVLGRDGAVLEKIYFEIILEDEYIQSISIDYSIDTYEGRGEKTLLRLMFDNVNELTEETSLAYKIFNERYENSK